MGAYKDKNGTWYAQFRFTNWKGEADRKTKRGFATKKEALEWEREFLTQSAGNLEMTFEAFYELYKKNLQDRLKKNTFCENHRSSKPSCRDQCLKDPYRQLFQNEGCVCCLPEVRLL